MDHLHVQIEIGGVKLEIIGNYWPGEAASWDSPGEDPSVEIEQILTANGDDIGGMMDFAEELREMIEEAALEKHVNGRADRDEYLLEEHNILRREMAMEAA